MACETVDCTYDAESVDYLLKTYYAPVSRPMRRCHPRDLLNQLRSYCNYHDQPLELSPERLDVIAASYFTAVPVRAVPHKS